MKSGNMAHACYPSTWEAESGASGVLGKTEFDASLGYMITLVSVVSKVKTRVTRRPSRLKMLPSKPEHLSSIHGMHMIETENPVTTLVF